MRAGHGLRSRTRDLFARPFLTKVYIPLSTYLRTYKIGDYVDVKVDGAIHKGMPHKVYHGRTGSVWNVSKRAIGVEINKQARSLEGQGLSSEQAEAGYLAISMAVNATLDEVSDTFVKKAD